MKLLSAKELDTRNIAGYVPKKTARLSTVLGDEFRHVTALI